MQRTGPTDVRRRRKRRRAGHMRRKRRRRRRRADGCVCSTFNIPSPLPLYHLYTQALLRLLSLPHATKCPGWRGGRLFIGEGGRGGGDTFALYAARTRNHQPHVGRSMEKKCFVCRKTWNFSPLANFELVLQSHVLACLRHSSRAFPLCKYLAEEERRGRSGRGNAK